MSFTYFLKNGDITNVVKATSIHEELEPGNYALSFSSVTGYFLSSRENFDLPKKIYGRTTFPDRVLHTFRHFNKGMGVLLSGPKGTGKTIEAKLIAKNSKMPVVLITSAYEGDGFVEFIENIKTPSVIFIDEFEKVYSDEGNRNMFLSIMDGVAKSRHLFLLTSNSPDIGEFFDSRPGRVRYHKHYDFLDEDVITQIIEDKLIDKSKIEDVKAQLVTIPSLSVDSLVCILDECNLYNELPKSFGKFFNVSIERPIYYNVSCVKKIAVPKKTIKNKNQIEEAKNLCYSYNENFRISDGDKTLFQKLCELHDVKYFRSYVNIFEYNNNPKTIEFNCSLFNHDGCYPESYHFIWPNDSIVEFTQNRKGFVAKHRDGSVMIGEAVKEHHRNAF